MSKLIARILLAVFLMPAACVVYLITYFLYCQHVRSRSRSYVDYQSVALWAFAWSGLATWTFVAVWWYLLWRKGVRWTGSRIGYTAGLFATCAIVGVIVSTLFTESDRTFGYFIGSAVAPLLWLVGSVFVWRETTAERAARVVASSGGSAAGGGVVCPTCGYNLTGLRESRCPECGAQYTLDQLLAAQPERVASATAAELES